MAGSHRGDGPPPPEMVETMNQPQSNAQLIQQANIHYTGGNYIAAGKLASTVFARDPDNTDAMLILGMVAHNSKNHELALQLLEKSLDKKPDQAHVLFHLSRVLQAMGLDPLRQRHRGRPAK